MGNKLIMLKSLLLIIGLIFITACNVQNTKPESEPKPDSELQELVSLRQKADSYYHNADWPNAITHYVELIQQVPKDAEIWFRLGNAHARLDQTSSALQAYQRAINLNPSNSKAWHNMGIIQLKLATNTFVNMKNYSNAGDPLHERASQVVDAISELLHQGFGIESNE
ncbi:MAG: tetratricopeptide repeat protein [Proteobacteria bacterium]|nr:tetratricopeptide repeat protein [Pseudomonadota bacterium]